MPAMPRANGKGKKIVYSILGIPPNMIDRRTSSQKRIDRRLTADETTRSR